ncbi:MAG: SAM-dependent chlorinase/fluorinase [Gammaproteobacteria bacterium]|nr:SAM-dependent chlorinase/fluorinase [Gammaproteobacteria bacterium]
MPSQQKLPERIALFSDFGEAGPYTGQMEAVLLNQGVRIPIIRLMSDAPRCDPRAAAYLLAPLSNHLPDNTLVIAVVDPGVGGSRLPLLLQTERHWFVGPDNGLFTRVIQQNPNASAHSIDWQPEKLSASFHGRDLFAPAAAAISQGMEIPLLPLQPTDLVGSDWPHYIPEIIYIDHYGNAFSGIGADQIDDDALLTVAGVEVGYARTFSDAIRGEPFWYRNSIGLVEIAVNQGRADQLLGLGVGQSVLMKA